MFGFSFGEILIIAIIAVLFLGPDKLPQTFIDIAKFIKAVKKTINDAKDEIDREIHISEIKQEALAYKKQIEQDVNNLTDNINKDKDLNELSKILNSPLDTPSYENKTTMQDLEEKGKQMAPKINKIEESSNKDSVTEEKNA